VVDSRCHAYLARALWSQKYAETCWKVTLLVAPNLIAVGVGVMLPGRRNDKRIWDENVGLQEAITFVAQVGDEWRQFRWGGVFDAGYRGLKNYYPEAVIKIVAARGHPLSAAQQLENHHIDTDRAVVERYNGVGKRIFHILGEGGVRLAHEHLPDLVLLCVAMTNRLQQLRRPEAMVPSAGFVRRVPWARQAPLDAEVELVAPPPIHPDDLLTGLNPLTADVLGRERHWPRQGRGAPPRNDAVPPDADQNR
jgi:hypothetical protein